MYIVTNCTPRGNYKPSIFNDLESATKWMYECTAGNIKAITDYELTDMSDKEICIWAESHLDVKVSISRTEITYIDDSYNIMEIFEVDDL